MAYIQAIAAIAGVQIDPPVRHDHGIDGKFVKIGLLNYPTGLRTLELAWQPIPFQAKASQKVGHVNGKVVFDLDAKNYNDAVSTAEILVLVMHHPPDIQNWLAQDATRLVMQHCCYYWEPPLSAYGKLVENKEKKRISFPDTQLFTAEALLGLFNRRQGIKP